MLVSPYTAPLIEGIARVLLYSKTQTFFETLAMLRQSEIDVAVVAFPRFRIALLLWLAGIPIRVGTGYRWYSFLFNRKVFEHRKTVEKHESEYNLSLLRELGCHPNKLPVVRLNITAQEEQASEKIRKSLGIKKKDVIIVLHPGSGGSAREWKPDRFAELAHEFVKRGYKVVIAGGSSESELVNSITRKAGDAVIPFVSNVSLKEYAAFIQTAQLFVANSTGPLHIAAIVGTPVIGFYPPVRVMSPKRWGPLTEKKVIFVPDPKKCPRCNGKICRGSDCMDQIAVHSVVEASEKLMQSYGKKRKNKITSKRVKGN